MAADLLSQYAVAGATRPDSFSGMQEQFRTSLGNMVSSAPEQIRAQLRIMSGYRSPQRQAELWQGALAKYGSPEAARKWVAPPGRSNHNHGYAADLRYLSPEARAWAHQNADAYGLAFPLANEPWHVELKGARGPHAHGGERGAAPQTASPSPPGPSPASAPAFASSEASAASIPFGVPPLLAPDADRSSMSDLIARLLQQSATPDVPAPPPPAPIQFGTPQGPTLADYITALTGPAPAV